MKKSVKILIHFGFWIYFPFSNAFSTWSEQFGLMGNMFFGHSLKNILQILSENIHSLFVPPDVGSEIWTISNLFGIIFHLYVYIILPICTFYGFYGIFMPKYIKYKTVKNTISPLIVLLIVPFAITTLFSFVTIAVKWDYTYSITLTYILAIQFAILGSLFKIFENWILSEKLAKQNLQSELTLLKNQINPHFLFNTLNNIDSLIKSNINKASETLVKLSDILRYMIYDTNIERVQLSNEIKHIESFIDLQKIQFANKDLVSLSILGDSETILVAPMLFIPFIENAFKHCNNKNIQNAIRINFTIDNKTVNFECINVFDKALKITKDNTGGIGLNLIKRRIELIYPDKHDLNIREENNTYKVSLLLNTDEY
jgi:two-component system, LytTR family, sensor kinase